MKHHSLPYIGILFVSLSLVWGCEDAPKTSLSDAQQALEAARQAGAPETAPHLFGQAEDVFQQAMNELQAQDEQFGIFRDYSKAEELLAQVKVAAIEAKNKSQTQASLQSEMVTDNIGDEKEAVVGAITEARHLVREAHDLLARAPEGKDVELVLQVMEIDLRSAESSLAEIPKEIVPEDYARVREKAEAANAVASRVRDQILQAIKTAEGEGL
ncbi:MAG: hypothetical protein NPIRA02_11030 [Nitrospirales bacterium]|nr:MAG: hypothetical protein NPIRA02_11030 [Nitrospirales bacterium]